MKTVKHTYETLPPLTEAQKEDLKRLSTLMDAEIDTNNMPELTDGQLSHMTRAEHYRPVKQQITARVDADVLAWLKAGGKGYQSRLNAILRQAMLASRK